MSLPPRITTSLLSLAALVAFALPAAPALAAGCPTSADLEQPFVPFGDVAQYFLAPFGSFETSTWKGGSPLAGNEPFFVRRGGATDRRSLAFGGTSVVVSPPTCIGLLDPTIRLFAVRTAGPSTARHLKVAVRYTGVDGLAHNLPLAPITSIVDGTWVVSAPTPILANATVLPRADGANPIDGLPTANVRFVFTPGAGTTWRIDDVFVDPYARN
jgi:hypothetical protein